jgi:hypothetical protein
MRPPWVEPWLDARAPGFVAAPKPSPRRAMLDPRRTSPLESSALKTTPVGRARARRPRSGIRPCTQAIAASSDARPTKNFAIGFLDAADNPVGRAMARRPRSRIRYCAHAIAASSDARPTKDLAIGVIGAEDNPRGSSHGSTPAIRDSPLHPSHRSVERCSTHEGPRHWRHRRRRNPRGSSHGSTPARLDSPLRPSHRRVERCSTHEGLRHWRHRR